MDELASEDDEVAGTEVAEEGISELREINRGRNRLGRSLRAG